MSLTSLSLPCARVRTVTLLMDSDDFYFPTYVSFVVRELVQQSALYIGLLGYHCTKMHAGVIAGTGYNWRRGQKPRLTGD